MNYIIYIYNVTRIHRICIFQFFGCRKKKGYIEYYPPTRPPQILIKNVLKNCFFSAFGKILVLVSAFSIQTLIINVLKNCFFSFWQDFGFGECFFYSNSH